MHFEIDATIYCSQCRIYMCDDCKRYHQEKRPNHKIRDLNSIEKELFCKEAKHNEELKYFCKNHNKLCCSKCINKIKDEENGQHSDCTILNITEIEEEKKNGLNENIFILENLSNNIEDSINNKKNDFKLYIQNIFKKFINILEERK